jgi:hypothetical protein
MDLSFRACKLQIRILVKGQYQNPSDLIETLSGFGSVRLAEYYFTDLERFAQRDFKRSQREVCEQIFICVRGSGGYDC